MYVRYMDVEGKIIFLVQSEADFIFESLELLSVVLR